MQLLRDECSSAGGQKTTTRAVKVKARAVGQAAMMILMKTNSTRTQKTLARETTRISLRRSSAARLKMLVMMNREGSMPVGPYESLCHDTVIPLFKILMSLILDPAGVSLE